MPLFHVFVLLECELGMYGRVRVLKQPSGPAKVLMITREHTDVVRYHCSCHKHSNMGIKFHELAITGWREETLAPDCTNISDRGKTNVQ